jgi:C-terminal processing protease CtpA/Prc
MGLGCGTPVGETSPGGSGGEASTEGPPPTLECEGDDVARKTLRAFWSRFDRDYALFDVRLPDRSWAALGTQTCAALGPDTDDDALFDALLELARNLDDGHVELTAKDLGRDEDAWVSVYPHVETMEAVELIVEEAYLEGPLSWAARDWVAWGAIGDVGYVSVTSMDGLARGGDEDDDRDAAAAAMAMVMSDLGDRRGMVVDIRGNGGGWDMVALEMATWFAGPRTVAWSEQRRDGPAHDDFGAWEDTFVGEGRPEAYTGPVVLLTSGATFSAAETFALAMRVRDRVTIVGEPTSGHFSDLFGGRLPNGWRFTLSAERYRAADGQIYEARGVPVDVEAPFDPDALAEDRDTMLEAALATL